MRIFLFSNVPKGIDRAVDLLKNHSIIARESSATTSSLSSMAAEELAKGGYDLGILIAKDPIGVGVTLNKLEGVIAVVCSSADDVRLANEDGANVLIMRDPHSDELQEIVSTATSMKWGSGQGIASMIKIPSPFKKKMAEEKKVVEEKQPKPQRSRLFAPKEKEEEEEVEPEPEDTGMKRSGIAGKLKDWLGII